MVSGVLRRAAVAGVAVVATAVVALPANGASAAEGLIFERVVHDPRIAETLPAEPTFVAFGPLVTQSGVNRQIVLNSDLTVRSQEELMVSGFASAPLSKGRLAYLDNACAKGGYSSCADLWIEEGGVRRALGLAPLRLDMHEVQRDEDGLIWALAYPERLCWERAEWSQFCGPEQDASTKFLDCQVVAFTPSGEVKYSWYASDHMTPSELRLDEHGDAFQTQYRDPFHCNSIDLESGSAAFLISMRSTDSVYFIDRSSGGVQWKVGGNHWPGRSLTVRGTTENPSAIFDSQHDARLWDDGVLSVFDNGSHTMRTARGLRLAVDPDKRIADVTGVFTDPSGRTSGCTGSFRPFSVGKKSFWVAGWGCSASGSTVFSQGGRPVVSTAISQDEYAQSITRPQMGPMRYSLSYRVTPLARSDRR